MSRVIIAGNRMSAMAVAVMAASESIIESVDVQKECTLKSQSFSDAMWDCPTIRTAKVEPRASTAPRKPRSKYSPHVGAKERARK